MTARRDVSVRRTGTESRPWEARCRMHRATDREELYFGPDGAVAFNTRGMGNRTWGLAMQAAEGHLRAVSHERRCSHGALLEHGGGPLSCGCMLIDGVVHPCQGCPPTCGNCL